MRCLGFLLLTTIVSQIVIASPSIRRRRGYYDHNPDRSIFVSPHEDPSMHPPWMHSPFNDNKPKQTKPGELFDYYEAFGINPDGNGYDRNREEPDRSRSSGSTDTRGYGQPSWWRPPAPPTRRPIPTSIPNPDENNKEAFLAMCIKTCRVTNEYNPVCGSNGVTYENPGRLDCAQNCGVPVNFSKLGACTAAEPITTSTSTESFLNIGDLTAACIRSCPVTSEFNPVCGSNNVTYSNPGRLECAQNCGVQVTLSRKTSCSVSEPITTSTSTENVVNNGDLIATCMRSCPVTSEFNPVCGSNNITYSNPGRLECAQNCGVEVQLSRHTSCEVPITREESTTQADNDIIITTTENSNVILITTTTTARPYVNENKFDGIKTNNDSANNNLNGTDDIDIESNSTAINELDKDDAGNSTIEGIGSYNVTEVFGNNETDSVEGVKDNDSSIIEDDENGLSEAKARPGGNNNCNVVNNKKPPSIKEVMTCMQTCTLTSESNPVCGTDSITYMNPGRLLCAQFCGVDVKVKKFAPCNSSSMTNVHCLTPCTNPPVTDNPTPVTPPLSTTEACMEACPASPVLKPVCGSNNITYRNLEKLQCARRCGVDVTLIRSTSCDAPVTKPNPNDATHVVQECIQQCSVPQKYDPICGSDNITYNNTGHLICARQCGLDIQVKQLYPCGTDPTTSVTSTTTVKSPVINPGNDKQNITIDPAIIASIWPEEEDEDFELDQRVKDKPK